MITGIIFVLFLALIVLGPKKTVEMCQMAGRVMNQFKQATEQFQAKVQMESGPAIQKVPTPETGGILFGRTEAIESPTRLNLK